MPGDRNLLAMLMSGLFGPPAAPGGLSPSLRDPGYRPGYFPPAPSGPPTDMSVMGPWGAGISPATTGAVPTPAPRAAPAPVPVPTPRPQTLPDTAPVPTPNPGGNPLQTAVDAAHPPQNDAWSRAVGATANPYPASAVVPPDLPLPENAPIPRPRPRTKKKKAAPVPTPRPRSAFDYGAGGGQGA